MGASGLPDDDADGRRLSQAEQERYSRQVRLPQVGEAGQLRLRAAKVLIVGAGGLGSPCAMYLAAAGVGTIGLVDGDTVDRSNLHRQLLYTEADVGHSKLLAARERLVQINPAVSVQLHHGWLTARNARELIANYDVVVDGTDNFATRYLVNDACVLTGRPNVHASVYQFEGQASVFATADGPCYRCLYPEPPPADLAPNCAEGGVLGVLPGLLGNLQAIETIKLLLGVGTPLVGRLLMVDTLGMDFRSIAFARDPDCPACGTRTLTELPDYELFCGPGSGPGIGNGQGGGESAGESSAESSGEIAPEGLAELLERDSTLQLVDVREPSETALDGLAAARLIPLGQLAGAASTLDPRRPVVVICQTGRRSSRAVEMLRDRGIEARSLRGGLTGWRASGR